MWDDKDVVDEVYFCNRGGAHSAGRVRGNTRRKGRPRSGTLVAVPGEPEEGGQW